MTWQDFALKKVALLGTGKDNLSLIPHLNKVKAKITAFEWNPPERPIKDLEVISGPDYLTHLEGYDWAFRSPGFPVATLKAACSKLTHAPQATSAIDLFLAIAPCPVIGVTGTKGKGTTSTMIADMLNAAGKKALVMGNIGEPVFDFFGRLKSENIAVVELSSFMLEDVVHSPDIAVVLPVTADHLQPLSANSPNYHKSREDYIAAKFGLVKYQQTTDRVFYAVDNDGARKIAAVAPSKKVAVSQERQTADWFVSAQGQVLFKGEPYGDLSQTGLAGEHVFLDATLAIATVNSLGVTKEDALKGLKNFKPLPHRMQAFAEYNGVAYVDDSYATAPDAAEAALTAFHQPIIWIAGGSKKGADFTTLAKKAAGHHLKRVVLIGEEAERLAEALLLEKPELEIKIEKTYQNAAKTADEVAERGDVVLLSPACASKDMFENAAERGDQFQEMINKFHANP